MASLVVASCFAGLCFAAASTAVASQEQSSALVEAARKNRERVEANRAEHGPARRFTDADLAGAVGSWPPVPVPRDQPESRDDAPPIVGDERESDHEVALGPDEDSSRDAPGDEAPDEDPTEEDPTEREAALRERLLDIEASLSAIGASALPTAPRNPNRFESGFDAARLYAEREEIRRELAELARRQRPPGG